MRAKMDNAQRGGQIPKSRWYFLPSSVSAAAVSDDPWTQCRVKKCKDKFKDGLCNRECLESECLRDGFDCHRDRSQCK